MDTESTSYSVARRDDRDGVLYLLENAPFKASIWHWQLEQNGALEQAIVARAGSEIVGFNGVMPVDVWLGSRAEPALWSCDFVVRSDQRRRGIGRGMKAELHRQSPLLMTLGISASAGRVLIQMDWREEPGPQEFSFLRERTGAQAGQEELVPAVAVDGYTTAWVPLPDEPQLTALGRRLTGSGVIAIVRDARYLRWRYAGHPLATYRYLTLSRAGECHALLIVRVQDDVLWWVDYLGPLEDASLWRAAVKAIEECSAARRLRCRTNWPALQDALTSAGWRPGGRLRFFIRTAMPMALTQPWFLMAGDSDGELLDAARRSEPEFEIRLWTEREFLASEPEWTMLLADSNADALFMSWNWQTLWWQHFGKPQGLGLKVLAAYDPQGRLAGLAPLGLRTVTWYGITAVRRLEPLGNIWRGPPTARIEYCQFVLRRELELPTAYALARAIDADPGWNEFVVQYLPISSATFNALDSVLSRRCLRRDVPAPAGTGEPIDARQRIADSWPTFAHLRFVRSRVYRVANGLREAVLGRLRALVRPARRP